MKCCVIDCENEASDVKTHCLHCGTVWSHRKTSCWEHYCDGTDDFVVVSEWEAYLSWDTLLIYYDFQRFVGLWAPLDLELFLSRSNPELDEEELLSAKFGYWNEHVRGGGEE